MKIHTQQRYSITLFLFGADGPFRPGQGNRIYILIFKSQGEGRPIRSFVVECVASKRRAILHLCRSLVDINVSTNPGIAERDKTRGLPWLIFFNRRAIAWSRKLGDVTETKRNGGLDSDAHKQWRRRSGILHLSIQYIHLRNVILKHLHPAVASPNGFEVFVYPPRGSY